MKGSHDDAIMAMAIAIYAGDISFTQLQRNEKSNKAMLESWVMSERTYDAGKEFYSYGTTFDPIGSMQTDGMPYSRGNTSAAKEQYNHYSWLFGPTK
jgi:hypothetical protein